jgi:hypothetical protein
MGLTVQKQFTMAAFKRYLNAEHGSGGKADNKCGNRTGCRKRPYGDYLYTSDRGMFYAEYLDWLNKHDVDITEIKKKLHEEMERKNLGIFHKTGSTR